MNLEIKKETGIIVVKPLTTIIDVNVSTEFKAKIVDILNENEDEDETIFILNLSQVEFIDSSGLGALISILKTLTLNKGLMSICNVNLPVLNLFKLTRTQQIFNIQDTENDAIGFLNKKAYN